MKLSIIIPTYNSAEYLRECLDSAFAQTIEKYQVIAIDDESTDNSLEILNEYRSHHDNMIVRHVKNTGGPGKPRNIGIDLAEGEYIFFLDADDVLEPFAMEEACALADKTGSDVILLRLETFGCGKLPMVARSMMQVSYECQDFIASNAYKTLGPWKLFRRSVVESQKVRFPVGILSGQDEPFVLRMYLLAKHVSALCDKIYLWIRSHPNLMNEPVQRGVHNLRLSSMPPEMIMRRVELCVRLIDKHVPSGHRRDLLLQRHFLDKRGFPQIFDKNFLKLERNAQKNLLDRAVEMRHLWSPSLKALAPIKTRILVDALLSDNLVSLLDEIHRQKSNAFVIYTDKKRLFSTKIFVQGKPKKYLMIKTNKETFFCKTEKLTNGVSLCIIPRRLKRKKMHVSYVESMPEDAMMSCGRKLWLKKLSTVRKFISRGEGG